MHTRLLMRRPSSPQEPVTGNGDLIAFGDVLECHGLMCKSLSRLFHNVSDVEIKNCLFLKCCFSEELMAIMISNWI